jgi:uncharacterized protein
MNMNLAMSSGAKEVANRNDEDIYEMARAFSKGLLMGARGNSGVITSQIFRGFAQGLEGRGYINAVEFAEAWQVGKEVAYKAVMRPVEGTILTVLRESADALLNQVDKSWTIEEAMEFMIKEARESLVRTPDLLPILKEVGVVDSGGAGLIKIFEGFISALNGIIIEKDQATAMQAQPEHEMAGAKLEAEEFGYCTEFILRIGDGESEKKQFVEQKFNKYLSDSGNSIVLVRDEDIVKVHIHTLAPGEVLTHAQQFGEFVSLKIENMSEQHSHITEESKLKSVNKAHESLHDPKKEQKEEKTKDFAIISVAAGKGLTEMFKKLRADYVISGGQTMNPSTEDFLEAIKRINAKNIFILPNNKNIVLAAKQAVEMHEDENKNIHVIESVTIPQGLVSCMMFNPEATLEENLNEMTNALVTVESGAVTFATKDTTINNVQITKDHFMGIHDKKIVVSNPDKYVVFEHLLKAMVNDMTSIVTVIYGEGVNSNKIKKLVKVMEDKFGDVEFELHNGDQPVYAFLIGVE